MKKIMIFLTCALFSLTLIQATVYAKQSKLYGSNEYSKATQELILKIVSTKNIMGYEFAEKMEQTIDLLPVNHPLIPMINSLDNCEMVLVYLACDPSYFSGLRDMAITNPLEARIALLQLSSYMKGWHDRTTTWSKKIK